MVVDDAWQGVTEVVRGYDLLTSTARQVHVARALGWEPPRHAHHPVAVTADGCKLSKRLGSDPLQRESPAATLRMALAFLGQRPPAGLALTGLWRWAVEHWDLARVPRRPAIEVPAMDAGPRTA